MATLKRSEILRKHASRGRPPKPAKERQLKQRAAYQWRDARRIYLAGSFERWRKLKNRLQLKDSSLAWHLLETHDKGCYNCSMPNMEGVESDVVEPQPNTTNPDMRDPSQFYPALVRNLRQLCLTYLQFEECVEVMGLICVEVDHRSKDNHSIKEVIKRGLLPKQRTHERPQSEHEANEADLVASVLSKMGNREGCSVSVSGCSDSGVTSQASTSSDNALSIQPSSSQVSDVTASLSSAQGHVQLPGTSCDRSDGCSEASPSPSQTVNETDANKKLLAQKQCEDSADYQQSDTQTVPGHTSSCVSYHNYDETDHATQSVSTHPVNNNISSPSESKSQPVAGVWQSLNHEHRVCMGGESAFQCTDPRMSCESGEMHKVVMSDDGMVSHVVHGGSVSKQVYRIDLSNHGEDSDREVSAALSTSHAQHREMQMGGEESRDRAASIESTDSFMEVGIVSKINHAQRLLASPTDQPSPSPSPVSDLTYPPNSDPYPFRPSDPASAHVSFAADPSHPHPGASPLPNHTSVIKQVCSTEVSSAVKTEAASASACDRSTRETRVSSKRLSVDESELPLDMSVVKEEEEDNDGDGAELVGRDTVTSAQSSQYRSSHGSEVASRASASPPGSTAGETAPSGDSSQLFSQVSSMQLLQHYTDRLLQQQQQLSEHPSFHTSPLDPADSEDASGSRKRKLSDLDDRGDSDTGRGIPWPRKDMTQKEEYQYLESDPFMDFAEMTRIFPNMQQRTFYRWKRRIKDQFIFLEQQPMLTYAQFSQIFPQVKDHVFEHWRRRIAQGHRFLADSGKSGSSFGDVGEASNGTKKMASGEMEGGSSQKEEESGAHPDSYISQYIFLQKNLSLDADQFSKLFPEVPQHLYYVWRKQIFSDFLKLQANPKMTYQEFRKVASVTQDVFTMWKTHLTLMTNPSPLMSTCSSLVSAPSPLSTATPTLPPVSLLAARAGKGLGAELAAWYASYAPLMGQVALPFWSPFSIMSSPPLPNALAGLRDNPSVDHEHSEEHPCSADGPAVDRSSERDISMKRRASGSSRSKDTVLHNAGETGGEVEPHTSEGLGGNGDGSVSHRGRRQSLKPEHYYYLLNPDTTYIGLTRIFPGVSGQRYGRWRRKVASALALLEREPQCTDDQFALAFPNVPDEILSSWRERVRLGNAHLMAGDDSALPSVAASLPTTSALQSVSSASPAISGPYSRDSSLGPEASGSTNEDVPNFLIERARDTDSEKSSEEKTKEQGGQESQSGPSARKQFKMNRQEFHFVQRYPNVDFGTFASHFPDVSVRTFYRWRRQIREAIDLLRTAPFMTLAEFQKLVPEVTEDVFEAWRVLVMEESQSQREGQTTPPERNGEELHLSGDGSTSSSSQLQQSHAGNTPDMGEMGSVNHKPAKQTGEVNGQHGSQEDGGLHTADSNAFPPDAAESRNQCRSEQWLLHMNPHLDYAEMQLTYPDVSQRTFYRWRQEVHQVMDYMREHPDVCYDDIVSCLPEVSHQAFLVWQELIRREKLSQLSKRKVETNTVDRSDNGSSDPSHRVSEGLSKDDCDDRTQEKLFMDSSKSVTPGASEQLLGLAGMQEEEGPAGKVRRQTRNEFVEVMLNPAMDYAEFALRLGTVSQRTFYRWRAHIRDWRAVIRADPQMEYQTFARNARDVPEYVFRIWQEWESRLENPHSTGTSSDGYEGAVLDSSHSNTGQSQHPQTARGTASASANSEAGHSHSSQLDMLWLAYDYYQRHPDIHFEALSAVFPAVTVDVFQQWKKSGDVMMEYIRSIPSTNFEDFHRLFTDVKEDVFNILKAKVLGQAAPETYLLPPSTASELTAPLAPRQPVYPSTSQTSTVQGPSQPEKVPGSLYDGEPGSKSSSLYQTSQSSATYSTPSSLYQSLTQSSSAHSPRLQPPSPTPSADNAETPRTVRVKQESSPNTPLPSFTETVSNLGRLSAMVQHRLSQTPPAASAAPPPPLLMPHSAASTSTSALHPGFSTALAGIVGQHKASTSGSHDSALLHLHSQVYPSVSPSSTSQAMAAAAAQLAAEDSVLHTPESNQPCTSGEEMHAGKEERMLETSAHSSQRQRKLQRVEYMFVLQNPDVDVQEFLTRFPQVSLRTFYRWKREIREDQQAGGGGTGSVNL